MPTDSGRWTAGGNANKYGKTSPARILQACYFLFPSIAAAVTKLILSSRPEYDSSYSGTRVWPHPSQKNLM